MVAVWIMVQIQEFLKDIYQIALSKFYLPGGTTALVSAKACVVTASS